LLAACAGRRPAAPPPAPAAPRGFVGLQFLPATDDGGEAARDPNVKFVPPTPRTDLVPPDYPAAPLAAGAGPFTVALRIRIDGEDGRVTHVGPSPAFPASAGPFESDFFVAAERAVRLWRFHPGRLERVERDAAADVTRVIESMAVAVLYDVRFDFEIVGGEPRVAPAAP
jgi:hypothetical protein